MTRGLALEGKGHAYGGRGVARRTSRRPGRPEFGSSWKESGGGNVASGLDDWGKSPREVASACALG